MLRIEDITFFRDWNRDMSNFISFLRENAAALTNESEPSVDENRHAVAQVLTHLLLDPRAEVNFDELEFEFLVQIMGEHIRVVRSAVNIKLTEAGVFASLRPSMPITRLVDVSETRRLKSILGHFGKKLFQIQLPEVTSFIEDLGRNKSTLSDLKEVEEFIGHCILLLKCSTSALEEKGVNLKKYQEKINSIVKRMGSGVSIAVFYSGLLQSGITLNKLSFLDSVINPEVQKSITRDVVKAPELDSQTRISLIAKFELHKNKDEAEAEEESDQDIDPADSYQDEIDLDDKDGVNNAFDSLTRGQLSKDEK